MKQTVEELCTAKGLRMTERRRIIVRVLDGADDHPDVPSIHARAVKADPHISISTVYRTVRLFQDAGILTRHHFGDGPSRFEAEPDGHHDHLIDLSTGKIIEFHSQEVERLQKAIAEELGYRLVGYRLELLGTPLEPLNSVKGESQGLARSDP